MSLLHRANASDSATTILTPLDSIDGWLTGSLAGWLLLLLSLMGEKFPFVFVCNTILSMFFRTSLSPSHTNTLCRALESFAYCHNLKCDQEVIFEPLDAISFLFSFSAAQSAALSIISILGSVLLLLLLLFCNSIYNLWLLCHHLEIIVCIICLGVQFKSIQIRSSQSAAEHTHFVDTFVELFAL